MFEGRVEYTPLTANEEVQYITKIQMGDRKLCDEFIKRNENLIWSYVNRFARFAYVLNVEKDDLFQEGAIGFIKAIRSFNAKKNCRLSTYANVCILREIIQLLTRHSRAIKIPKAKCEFMQKLEKLRNELMVKGQEITDEELANELGMDAKVYREIFNAFYGTISLDKPINKEGDILLGDVIKNKDIDPEYSFHNKELQIDVKNLIVSTLTRREIYVLDRRFGISNGETNTLKEIGKDMNITRERVRQIEAGAIKKLKAKATRIF